MNKKQLRALISAFMFLLATMQSGAPQPMEDSKYFNCHFHGNKVCGPGAPWHGFVNLHI